MCYAGRDMLLRSVRLRDKAAFMRVSRSASVRSAKNISCRLEHTHNPFTEKVGVCRNRNLTASIGVSQSETPKIDGGIYAIVFAQESGSLHSKLQKSAVSKSKPGGFDRSFAKRNSKNRCVAKPSTTCSLKSSAKQNSKSRRCHI